MGLMASNAAAADALDRFNQFDEASTITIDHTALGEFMEEFSETGSNGVVLIDYGAVEEAEKAELDAYIDRLEAVDPASLARDEAFAFWANLYNAVTVSLILDNYPVKSIRDIRPGLFSVGPWKMELIEVDGVSLSLDDVEHDILRAFWSEPRVHYAVNCASIGCPNLPLQPWTSEGLDERLTQAAKAYINNPRGVLVKNGRVTASTIYRWFKEDFGGNEEGVLSHIRQHASPALSADLEGVTRISGYAYDWSLNDASTQ